jgi:hypothetical protein
VQRSGSIFRLGIETQKLTTAIGQLAKQLQTDDDDSHSQVLAELEAALLAEEGNKADLAPGLIQSVSKGPIPAVAAPSPAMP